jgi:prophage regulatory protein
MSERLLTWPQVAAMVPYTRQHVHRLERAGQFPQRLQIGPARVAWKESEVAAWIDGLARGAPPKRGNLIRQGA